MLERMAHSPFIGRTRELAEADAAFHRVLDGEGHVLLVSGEPGIGKTRLVREVISRSQQAGAQAFVCECRAEGGSPYAPFTQLLRQAFSPSTEEMHLPDFVLADLAALTPALRALFPAMPTNPGLDPRAEQERLYDSVGELCAALSANVPFLLVVEDVHWADSGTLAVLRHLARRAPKLRFMLVLTYREEELHAVPALSDMLLDLNRERLATHLRLSPLTVEQTRDLLAALFGSEFAPPFLDRLYRETEGNPFFIEEVIKGLLEDGTLHQADERWRWPEPEQVRIPQSVRTAIRARVEKFPAPVQEALRLAAIIGREFEFDVLHMASGLAEDQLIDMLEIVRRTRLIDETRRGGRSVSIFAHALIPSALREDIIAPRRQRLHRQVGNAIESLYPDEYEALAYHFGAAGERDKAIRYSRSAARSAESVYAYEVAAQHLNNALGWLNRSRQTETYLAVLEQLADIYHLQGNFLQAAPLYRQAIALSPTLTSEDKMVGVRLRRKFGDAVFNLVAASDFQRFEGDARAQLQAARQIAEAEPPHVEIVYLLNTLSMAQWIRQVSADWAAAERFARAAIDMAEQLDEPVVLSVALETLAYIYGARGLLRERIQLAERRLQLSRDSRFLDQRERVRILLQFGAALSYVGEYRDALRHLLEAQTLAGQIHAADLQTHVLGSQMLCWLRLDRWDEILQSEQALRALQQRYTHEAVTLPCWNIAILASVYAFRGAFEQAALLRSESFQMMAARKAPDGWNRPQHY